MRHACRSRRRRANRRPCLTDLRRSSSPQEARECSRREAIPSCAQGDRAVGVPMPRRDRCRIQRAVLFRSRRLWVGFLGTHPRHDQGHLEYGRDDLEGTILCESIHDSRRAGRIRTIREAEDPVPPRARSKETAARAEASTCWLQGRARAPSVGPRSLAPRDVAFRRRCCRGRPPVRQTYADRGDLSRREESPFWMVYRDRKALHPATSRRPPSVGWLGVPRHHTHRNGRRALRAPPCLPSKHRNQARALLPGLGYSHLAQSRKSLLNRGLSCLPLLDPLARRRMTFRGDPSALTLSPLRGARGSEARPLSLTLSPLRGARGSERATPSPTPSPPPRARGSE